MKLLEWKNSPYRKPLILRGARQVGKSYLIREFAKNEYKNSVEINLELQPELKTCFNTKDPYKILKNIQLVLNREIIVDRTILFIDEIQECPEAILTLRYFFELMPELHLIAAGSLLEFALNSEDFRSPVGRIEYLHLYPLNFEEFLDALGENLVLNFLHDVKLADEFANSLHEKLLDLYVSYLLVGGMPEAIKVYIETKNFMTVKKIQLSLLQTYRNDFSKYANHTKQKYLEKVFYHIPVVLGNKVKYANIDKDVPSRELKNAIDLLENAGVIHRILSTSKAQLPLSYYAKDNFYKLIFMDIGLVLKVTGLEETVLTSPNLLGVYEGGMAEQFVGQELIANCDPVEKAKLFNWERMKPSSTAEIDYLFVYRSNIYPIEVKAGKTGSLKSLQIYTKENQNSISIRYSKLPLSFHEGLLSIPLYMIAETERLIDEIL
jgi:uncharacterized protein